MKQGDTFTIAGVHTLKRNPQWRWWKPWANKNVHGGIAMFKLVSKPRDGDT